MLNYRSAVLVFFKSHTFWLLRIKATVLFTGTTTQLCVSVHCSVRINRGFSRWWTSSNFHFNFLNLRTFPAGRKYALHRWKDFVRETSWESVCWNQSEVIFSCMVHMNSCCVQLSIPAEQTWVCSFTMYSISETNSFFQWVLKAVSLSYRGYGYVVFQEK